MRIDLDALSRDQLADLSLSLKGLIRAGEAILAADLCPEFDLTPGREARILCGFTVPEALSPPAAATGDAAVEPSPAVFQGAAGEVGPKDPDPPAAPLLPGEDERVLAQVCEGPAPVQIPETPAASAGDSATGDAPQTVAQPPSAATDPLAAHLAGVPRDRGWTLQNDDALMRLACLGWPPQEIDAEMDIAPGAAKARFDLLTAKRRYRLDEVLAALQTLLPLADAAE